MSDDSNTSETGSADDASSGSSPRGPSLAEQFDPSRAVDRSEDDERGDDGAGATSVSPDSERREGQVPETRSDETGLDAESSAASKPEERTEGDAATATGRAPSDLDAPTARPSGSAERSRLDRVQGAVEALLLAAGEPLEAKELEEALEGKIGGDEGDGRISEWVERALERLQLEFSGSARGIHLEEVAGGYQFRTNPDYRDHVRDFVEANPVSLSRAATETLAIVAYRQPITRADIEEIRGVDSSGVLRTLVDYELVETTGRLDDLGRPYVYGTTERFLEHFGLSDLSELPELSEDERETIEQLRDEDKKTFDETFE